MTDMLIDTTTNDNYINIDSISFDSLIFHNAINGIFQAAYYFPENYTMIVKTEKKIQDNINRIYPNKYQVSLLHDNIPVIQNDIFKIKDRYFQTEIQVTILMKQIMLWIIYNNRNISLNE